MPRASNRGNPTPATTQLSAALTIWAWMVAHGRPPKAVECTNENGLLGHRTYYRIFEAHNFSATIIPMVSALVATYKTRTCLGYTKNGDDCHTTFPDVGAHVRLCHACRAQALTEPEHAIPMQIQRLTLRDIGAGSGGWDVYEGWVRDIDWSA